MIMANSHNNTSASMLIPRAVFNTILDKNAINICHINVQSLCARNFSKFHELKANFFNSKMDIVCMTETWLGNVVTDQMISIEGYNLLRNDRDRHGGGLCIYIRNNLSFKILQSSIPCNPMNSTSTTEFLVIEVRSGLEPFLLSLYYNPPDNDCSELLRVHFEQYTVKYNHTFFIGDFNTDL